MRKKIGLKIREYRKNANLNQNEFAEKLGVTNRAVSNWETGANGVDIEMIPAICEVLGISPNDLLDSSADQPTPDELSIIQAIRALDAPGKAAVLAILELQTKRIEEFGPARKRKTIPLINGILDGTIETKYAAKQEQKELEKESTADLANQEV